MLDIKFLENSGYFEKITLEKGELLFDEGEIDNNIYIVILGELYVEKYTTLKKDESKILASLKKDDIFGEAALNNNNPKGVKIIANKKTYLLSINAKDGLDLFSKKFPKEGQDLLKYIIFLGNKRLNESNYLITSTYKISTEIINLDKISNKSIFELISKLKDTVKVDYILYFEKNPIMDKYFILRYDTREEGKMQDKIVEIKNNKNDLLLYKNNLLNNKLDLLSNKVEKINSFIQELSIGKNHFGFLIFFKKDSFFSENDKKVLISTSTSIAGVIKEKQLFDEQRDKEFMEE